MGASGVCARCSEAYVPPKRDYPVEVRRFLITKWIETRRETRTEEELYDELLTLAYRNTVRGAMRIPWTASPDDLYLYAVEDARRLAESKEKRAASV